MKKFITLAVTLVLTIPACSLETSGPGTSPLADDGDTPIVTDAVRYELRPGGIGWEGEIGFHFQNVTDATISLVNCNRAYALALEKRVDGEWTMAWGPVLPECLSPPIEIEPGELLSDSIVVTAGRRGSNYFPQFEVDPVPGVYRLVVTSAYHGYDPGPPWGEPVPLEARVSNSFEIAVR